MHPSSQGSQQVVHKSPKTQCPAKNLHNRNYPLHPPTHPTHLNCLMSVLCSRLQKSSTVLPLDPHTTGSDQSGSLPLGLV